MVHQVANLKEKIISVFLGLLVLVLSKFFSFKALKVLLTLEFFMVLIIFLSQYLNNFSLILIPLLAFAVAEACLGIATMVRVFRNSGSYL